MKIVKILKTGSDQPLVERAGWCSSRRCKLVGLQFRRSLAPGEGLVLVWPHESVVQTSIHMFFVFFPIAAIWVNRAGLVTGARLARPWRPYYASPEPACYVIEADPSVLDRVRVGDQVTFFPAP